MSVSNSPLPPVPPEARTTSGDDKIWIIACHLSPLVGVAFLLPFIVWLAKRGDAPAVAAHAAAALNFHLSVALYCLVCVPFCFVLIGFPLIVLLLFGSVVLAIVAAVTAANGGFFHYPLTLPIFR